MDSFTHGIGKGLREPCSPYREAYFFGAGLNEPAADGWNCIPAIVSPTASFDLSAISPGQEVVVALLGISDAPEGDYAFRFRWYRERDGALLYTYTFNQTSLEGGWLYGYSYIGYVGWEINENGGYYVLITATGPVSFSRKLSFTVSGIPIEPVQEPIPIGAIGWISQRFADASGFFYSAYREALGWVYPLWLIADPLYALSEIFSDLSWDFYHFNEWVEDVASKIVSILSWSTIWSYILSYVPNLLAIGDWFYSWWYYVTQVINNWWLSTQSTVQAWIEEAKNYTITLVDNLNTVFASLQSAWDDFQSRIPSIEEVIYWWSNWTGNVTSVINTWWTSTMGEVQDLINSAFIVRESWWAGWQDWRDKVTEFFTDPEDWLYKAVDRIIERFW